MPRPVRIGNAHGFWGDRLDAAGRDARAGAGPRLPDARLPGRGLDVDPGPAALARSRRPAGRGTLLEIVRSLAPYWRDGGRCRVVTNAGGLNPLGCARGVLRSPARCRVRRSNHRRRLAATTCSTWSASAAMATSCCGTSTRAQPIADVRDRLVTANAYLGAQPIAEALDRGADLVITGRVADPSLTVAACAHWFGWALGRLGPPGRRDRRRPSDRMRHAGHRRHRDRLARTRPTSTSIGFPIVEVAANWRLRRHEAARQRRPRLRSRRSRSNLLYEIGDPGAYLSPDVTLSLLSLAGRRRSAATACAIRGARGRPAPPTYKVSATYQDGFRAQGRVDGVRDRRLRQSPACRTDGSGGTRRARTSRCANRLSNVSARGPAARKASTRRWPDSSRKSSCASPWPTTSREAVERFARALMPLGDGRPAGHDRLRRRASASPSAVPFLAVPGRARRVTPRMELLAQWSEVAKAAAA